MSDIAALEAHLRARSDQGGADDWESWLVYADHLRDQGDTRCEAIELEYRLSAALCPEERGELRRQVEAMVAAHREEWLEGVETVGITSGASAPEDLVEDLVEFFRQRGAESVSELKTVEEDVRFMLPNKIRRELAERDSGGGTELPVVG